MALDADPYRTLGLPRGASIEEVKRAYRKLAKVNHPDVAGEAALPRFLAIRAAYEQLAGGPGAAGRGRPGSAAKSGNGAGAAPRRPWQADPDRGDATRRAYGGRARGPRPAPGGTTGAGPAGPAAGSAGSAGPAGPAAGSGGPAASAAGSAGSSTTGRRRRGPEPSGARERSTSPGASTSSGPGSSGEPRDTGKRSKATLGSTSYDGAADGPFEPDWGGASWYGTTSGTYWTLNPKEYADPRKHGPEYQARAARARAARERATKAQGAGTDEAATAAGMPGSIGETEAEPVHTTSSWWDSTSGPEPGDGDHEAPPMPARDPAPRRRPRPTGTASAAAAASAEPPPPDLGQAATDLGRALTDERSGGLSARVVRAIVGWLPIALGLGWAAGELTGCGRFAATCDQSAEPVVLVLQLAALAVLLLVPVLASLATAAAISVVAVAASAALILSAAGGAADTDSRRAALGAVLLLAWLVGLAFAVARRVRVLRTRVRPVS
jgi:hypothetical protein